MGVDDRECAGVRGINGRGDRSGVLPWDLEGDADSVGKAIELRRRDLDGDDGPSSSKSAALAFPAS